jgi:molybdenum cofactor cytidylyltransferase
MIAAVVLAAGLSRRMGRPKMTLPWGGRTVIGQVVQVLDQAGVDEIVVVTGGAHEQVESALTGLPARISFNPRFTEDEMVFSLKTGLSELGTHIEAALIALGDQPQVQPQVVKSILETFKQTTAPLIIPSYHLRRGHPWLVARPLWSSVLDLEPGKTMRDVINQHADQIYYLNVETPSVLRDLDTPEDYRRERP